MNGTMIVRPISNAEVDKFYEESIRALELAYSMDQHIPSREWDGAERRRQELEDQDREMAG